METWPITLNPRHNRTRFTLVTRSSRAGLSVFDANLMTVANTRSAAPAAVGLSPDGNAIWRTQTGNPLDNVIVRVLAFDYARNIPGDKAIAAWEVSDHDDRAPAVAV
jgi:hypothetical protein